MKEYSVLFVCYGNICRSPSAHGVFRSKLAESPIADLVTVDSAATHDLHPGDAPDPRSQKHALDRGYDISDLRARQVTEADAEEFDLILAMDQKNVKDLKDIIHPDYLHKVWLVTDFCSKYKLEHVPDPYYGESADFEMVLNIVEDASSNILMYLQEKVHKNNDTT